MRVGLVSTLCAGRTGRAHADLAAGLVARGVDVRTVCATRRSRRGSRPPGRRATVMPLRHQLDVGGARRVRRALAGVDIVHARTAGRGCGPAPAAAGAARVYTVHGLPEPYLPPPAGSERPGLRARVAYRGVDALLARRADAVITVSHAVERELVTRLGWPAERIR